MLAIIRIAILVSAYIAVELLLEYRSFAQITSNLTNCEYTTSVIILPHRKSFKTLYGHRVINCKGGFCYVDKYRKPRSYYKTDVYKLDRFCIYPGWENVAILQNPVLGYVILTNDHIMIQAGIKHKLIEL